MAGYNQSSEELTETLLEAVDTIIGARLSQLPYDKTIVCTIMDDSQRGIGKYRVSADEVNLFTAYADPDIEYFKGTQVYVKILNNNVSVSRIITGKYVTASEAYTSATGLYGTFYPYLKGDAVISRAFSGNSFKCTLTDIGEQQINAATNRRLIGYNGYSGMRVTVTYKQTGLTQTETARLLFKVQLNKDVNVKHNSRRKTIAFESDNDIALPVNNIINNSSLESTYSLYFYLDNYIDIQNINLIAEFSNINADVNSAFIITNVDITFGYWIKTLGPNNDVLLIIPNLNGSNINDFNNTNITSQNYNDTNRTGQIFTYKYLHVYENQILFDNNLPSGLEDNSFDAIISKENNKYKKFFGFYDASYSPEEINDGENDYNVLPRIETIKGNWRPLTWNSNQKTAQNEKDLNTSFETIRLGLFFDYNRAGWGTLVAQDCYLYNDSFSSKSGSITKGLTASFDDATNGNYFIYDKDGNLLNMAAGDKIRTIKIQYTNTTNTNDKLDSNDTCSIDFSNNNTMIIPVTNISPMSATNGYFEFQYKIQKQYNQNYNNNIINFSLIHNGTRYNLSVELLFGYSGSEENKYTIYVNYKNGDTKVPIETIISNNNWRNYLDIKVYDYTKMPIEDASIDCSNFPTIVAQQNNTIIATTYFALAESNESNYTYNGPTIITYDEHGSIKYNKTKCALYNKDTGEPITGYGWSCSPDLYPNYLKYFTINSNGEFIPAKICDIKSSAPKTFVLEAKHNNIILWKQMIIFIRNENITSTQPSTTSEEVALAAGQTITNVALGRLNEDKTAGVVIADVKQTNTNTNPTYGIYAYKKNGTTSNQIFALTEDGDLKIGISGKKHSDTASLSDLASNIQANYDGIFDGTWRVSEAKVADTATNLANINTSATAHFTYINPSTGAAITSNSNIGTSTNPVYIDAGEIKQIGTFNINGTDCTLEQAFAKIVAALNNAKPNSGTSVWS